MNEHETNVNTRYVATGLVHANALNNCEYPLTIWWPGIVLRTYTGRGTVITSAKHATKGVH